MGKKVSEILLEKLGEKVRKNQELNLIEWKKLMLGCPHRDEGTIGCVKPSRRDVVEDVMVVCAFDLCPFITRGDRGNK